MTLSGWMVVGIFLTFGAAVGFVFGATAGIWYEQRRCKRRKPRRWTVVRSETSAGRVLH
jgi:hypothetical protein